MTIVGVALQNPDCPFNVLVLTSVLSSVGGSSFVSSMSNFDFFYPRNKQGNSLGMSGGLGNLEVSFSQFDASMSELKMYIASFY